MQIWAIGIQCLCGVALGILVFSLILKAIKRLSLQAYSIGLFISGVFALGLTWYVLFWFMTLTTGRILAPWDQWAGFAPPSGIWQRQLNDFFSQDSNQHLLALVIMSISVILFLVGMLRATNIMRSRLPLAFTAANLAFLLVGLLSVIPVNRIPDLWLPHPRSPVDVGYHRTWPDILITGVLLGMLFWTQIRLATPSFWSRLVRHSPLATEGDG